MNIILFTDRRGQARNIEVSLPGIGIILLALLAVFCAASAYTGFRLGGSGHDQSAELQAEIRRLKALTWCRDLSGSGCAHSIGANENPCQGNCKDSKSSKN